MRYDELRHRPDVVKLQVQSKAHVDTRLPSLLNLNLYF